LKAEEVAHLEASAGAAVRSGIVLEALVAGVAGGGVMGSDEDARGEGAVNGAGGGGGAGCKGADELGKSFGGNVLGEAAGPGRGAPSAGGGLDAGLILAAGECAELADDVNLRSALHKLNGVVTVVLKTAVLAVGGEVIAAGDEFSLMVAGVWTSDSIMVTDGVAGSRGDGGRREGERRVYVCGLRIIVELVVVVAELNSIAAIVGDGHGLVLESSAMAAMLFNSATTTSSSTIIPSSAAASRKRTKILDIMVAEFGLEGNE
jgi:hypothetical protein